MIEHKRLCMSVQLDPNLDNLMGFIFYFVIPHLSSKERDKCNSSCQVGLGCRGNCGFYLEGPTGWHYSMTELNSNGVFLWYDPLFCDLILRNLQPRRSLNNYDELLFDFFLKEREFELIDCLIKECGVRLIYVLEYTNFLQQKKMKVSTQRKRYRNSDDDDQHQPSSTKKLKEPSIIQSIPLNSESMTSHNVHELRLMLSQLKLESTKNHTH